MASSSITVEVEIDMKQAQRDLARLARRARSVNRQLNSRWWRNYALALTAIDVVLGVVWMVH